VTTLGVGIDVVDVGGFAEQLADAASGFVAGTFTPREQRDAMGEAHRLAARFAAKEAFVKAWSGARLGLPPALPRVDLREIEVTHDPHGRPALRLHGTVRAAVGEVAAHLSLSHDGPVATAIVVLDDHPQARLGTSSRSRHSATAESAAPNSASTATGPATSATPPPSSTAAR